jgi:hypothetical protein
MKACAFIVALSVASAAELCMNNTWYTDKMCTQKKEGDFSHQEVQYALDVCYTLNAPVIIHWDNESGVLWEMNYAGEPGESCATSTKKENISTDCRYSTGGDIYVKNHVEPCVSPLDPGPGEDCQSANNGTVCKSRFGGRCAWCKSSDGLHQLCYNKAHLPDTKAWSCDKAIAAEFVV